MKIIRGKKALVTGAASGIGRSIALALAHEGADLCLLDTDAAKLDAVVRDAQACGVKAVAAVCDLAQPAQISAAVRSLLADWGAIQILVNNAGVLRERRTHEETDDEWRKLVSVNLLAPMQLTHELLPVLLEQDEAHIVNMCSILGLVTIRKAAAYQAGKFGLVGFTEALRAEYGRSRLGITAICPGLVRTPGLQAIMDVQTRKSLSLSPSWVWTDPDSVAAATVRAIYRNRGLVVVPFFARLLWRIQRFAPDFIHWIYRKGWQFWK